MEPAQHSDPREKPPDAADTVRRLLGIRVQITDKDALMAPNPDRTRAHLVEHGWERLTADGEVREIWRHPFRDGFYEVLRPSSKEYVDYALRMSEFLRTLSVVEDRSELAIWHDLTREPDEHDQAADREAAPGCPSGSP